MSFLKIKAENIVFETPTDLLKFTIKGKATKKSELNKILNAISKARENTESNNNYQYGKEVVITTNLIDDIDNISFEEILQHVHKIQQYNDIMSTIKIVGAFGAGIWIGRHIPKIGKF